MSYFVVIFILSPSVHQISGRTTISQTIGDNILYAACGRLCDKPDIDAIAPLSVDTDKQFMVTIVRDGLCSWILDMNDPKQNRDWGRRHHYKYDLVESLYTIFDDPKSSNKFNVTALFTSGMVSEIWRSVDQYIKKDSEGPLPLMGLGYNMQMRIDASFGWQPNPQTRVVYIIQNDTYYGFDLKKKKRFSGPNSITKDYSYDFKTNGKIQGAFRRGFDIYFFSGQNGYYIWKSKDGKTGSLSEKLSVTKDFYNCDTRYTTPTTSHTKSGDIEVTTSQEDSSSEDNSTLEEIEPKEEDTPSEETEEVSQTVVSLKSDPIVSTKDVITESEKSFKVMTTPGIGYQFATHDKEIYYPDTVQESPVPTGEPPYIAFNGSEHKVFLSVKVLLILFLISMFEYFSK